MGCPIRFRLLEDHCVSKTHHFFSSLAVFRFDLMYQWKYLHIRFVDFSSTNPLP